MSETTTKLTPADITLLAIGKHVDQHPVMLALSKARAAWWLLDALDGGNTWVEQFNNTVPIATTEEDRAGIHDWLTSMMLQQLVEALVEAEAEFRILNDAIAPIVAPRKDGEPVPTQEGA